MMATQNSEVTLSLQATKCWRKAN